MPRAPPALCQGLSAAALQSVLKGVSPCRKSCHRPFDSSLTGCWRSDRAPCIIHEPRQLLTLSTFSRVQAGRAGCRERFGEWEMGVCPPSVPLLTPQCHPKEMLLQEVEKNSREAPGLGDTCPRSAISDRTAGCMPHCPLLSAFWVSCLVGAAPQRDPSGHRPAHTMSWVTSGRPRPVPLEAQ